MRPGEKAQPMVRLEGVSKAYGSLEVLRGIDLEIPSGQTVSIIGPSGSGKSTLLRLLMTLDQPDSGTIEIDGETLWSMPRPPNSERSGIWRGKSANGSGPVASSSHLRLIRGKVGMVFQHFNLFPHMTALGNVAEAPVQVQGLNSDQGRERARQYLELVGLGDKLSAYPHELSGGQKQRVAIARALALRPKVMLFDEITSALDPELVGGILAILQDLARQRLMTMLIVTHHMKFAERCSDRVLFFEQGKIHEDGPPQKLFHTPSEERTREFLQAVLAD